MTKYAPDLLLGTDNDLTTVNGDLVLSSEADAVAQACRNRCLFFKGEWFADEDVGLLSFTDMLGKKNPNLNVIRSAFRTALLGVPGVDSVESVQVEIDANRNCNVTWRVIADSGVAISDSVEVQ